MVRRLGLADECRFRVIKSHQLLQLLQPPRRDLLRQPTRARRGGDRRAGKLPWRRLFTRNRPPRRLAGISAFTSPDIRTAARYCAVQPPSIGIAAPVILWAIGWASHRDSAPISLGCDVRRLGCFSASRLAIAASRSPPKSAARAKI